MTSHGGYRGDEDLGWELETPVLIIRAIIWGPYFIEDISVVMLAGRFLILSEVMGYRYFADEDLEMFNAIVSEWDNS